MRKKTKMNNKNYAKKTSEKKIIFDGRQFVLKFPKKFIQEAEINLDEDRFLITLKIPHPQNRKLQKPKLKIGLIRKN